MLDRIDELVAPGVTVNPDDNSYGDHELTPRLGAAETSRRAGLARDRAAQTEKAPRSSTAGPFCCVRGGT